MDSISGNLSSSAHDLALLKLESDNKLENLTKLVHFLSGKSHLVLTRYEVFVTVDHEEEKNQGIVSQYNCYIIKEGQQDPNEEHLESKKQNLKNTACQTESESLFLDNSISLNLNCTKVKVATGAAESHRDKFTALASNGTRRECGEIKQMTDNRNSADRNGNNHNQKTDNSDMHGTGYSQLLQDSGPSLEDIIYCDADFELDQKPIITSDVLIPVDTAAACEVSSSLVEPPGKRDRQFRCLKCGLTFIKAESLLVHEISHATLEMEKLMFKCPLCVYKTKSETAMPDHAKEKHQMEVHLCKGCKLVALSLQQLEDHNSQCDYQNNFDMVRSDMELSGQYICASCQYEAPDASALSRHMTVHEKKNYECQKCFLCFKTAEHLSAHSAAHETNKFHQCVQCSYTTHSKIRLSNHIRKHHNYLNGKMKCNDCGLHFSNRNVLRNHARTFHNNLDRFFCSYCTFTSLDQKTYRQHVQGHTGKELLFCDECDFTAFLQSKINKHQVVHLKVAPYQCCKCGRMFRDNGNLVKHMVTHREDRSFQCETCGFRTKSARYLKDHKKSHIAEKSFKCDLCDYSTRYSGNLHKHVQIHCAEKPFSCHLCFYTCRLKDALKRHRRRKHKLLN